jgi:hypothetical protein
MAPAQSSTRRWSPRTTSRSTGLGAGERRAVNELLDAGRQIGDLNEETEHHQALRARGRLEALHERLGRPRQTADLLELYQLFRGPIATTLENEREPFLPVDPFVEGRNVYPWAIEAGEIEAFETRPDRRPEILGLHTAVRRTTAQALRADLATLRRHAVLDHLHPGLHDRLATLAEHPAEPFYAVPYSVAWPDRILTISTRLWRAAEAVAPDDADLAAFLRQRSRDLLTDDNEAGDAAWVRGSFGRLDVVVGAYEQYDDDLFGAKGFFGLTLLLRDEAGTPSSRSASTISRRSRTPCPSTGIAGSSRTSRWGRSTSSPRSARGSRSTRRSCPTTRR